MPCKCKKVWFKCILLKDVGKYTTLTAAMTFFIYFYQDSPLPSQLASFTVLRYHLTLNSAISCTFRGHFNKSSYARKKKKKITQGEGETKEKKAILAWYKLYR